jgi:hypothetical protein
MQAVPKKRISRMVHVWRLLTLGLVAIAMGVAADYIFRNGLIFPKALPEFSVRRDPR